MYVHPLACSPTSGSHVCQDAVTPLQTPPTGTSLVFNAGIRGADDDPSRNKWDELGFQIILNPYESFSGMRARVPSNHLFFSPPQLFISSLTPFLSLIPGDWSVEAGMRSNYTTNGMSFILKMKNYILAVAPENHASGQTITNGERLVLILGIAVFHEGGLHFVQIHQLLGSQ